VLTKFTINIHPILSAVGHDHDAVEIINFK
jgi:hypothetical protein